LGLVYLQLIPVIAQQDSTGKRKLNTPYPNGGYCVFLKKGKVEVISNGKALKADVELKNGNKITASGTVIRLDGTIQMIKPGNCVNSEGNEVEQAKGK
jgi:hypothetical protein